jgi:iron(III) transport system ATP-binding protein
MVAVTIDKLAVTYGDARVIDNLSLTIESGSFFTLLGPSGCGKTTLLRTLAGFLDVADGRLLLGERDLTRVPAHQRDIGMVFQDYALFPDKSVFDNVAYGLRARKLAETAIKPRVGEYLERVGLSGFPDRRPAELSGGQRQRVALARALVIQPQLLLMDEPLSNLDAKLRVQVRETIADLQHEAGITTVFVTHDQEEALALSDRIGLMKQGKLEQVGTPEDIYRTPVSAYVADFVGAANTVAIRLAGPLAAGDGQAVPFGGALVSARVPKPIGAGKAVLIVRPEDVMLDLPSPTAIAAVVASKQYLGGTTHYAVTLSDCTRLSVALHGPGHSAHAVGATVSLALDAAKVLVVAS